MTKGFECKDCYEIYPSAEFFVYHIDKCIPKKTQLEEALTLLRNLVVRGKRVTRQETITHEDDRMLALDSMLDKAYTFVKPYIKERLPIR